MKKFTKLLAIMVVFLMSTSLFAQERETIPEKSMDEISIVEKSPESGRAAGDDITNPLVINHGDLPFSESNSTCGHLNV